MKLTAWSRFVNPSPLLWAAGVSAAITAISLVIIWSVTDKRETHLEQFGSSLAESLAYLSMEPLMKQDRIHLGVLANRIAEVPEVIGVGIFTVDDKILALSGTLAGGASYTSSVTSGDAIVGYIKLSVNAMAFNESSTSVRYLLSALVIFITPFLIVAGFNFKDQHRLEQAAAASQAPDDPETASARYLLAINLYNQLSMTPPERELELAYALTMAEQVANLYQGRAAYLPGTGILVGFEHNDDKDRAFEVMCAAFVLANLLDEDAGRGTYRLAIHELILSGNKKLEVSAPEVLDTILLSALAKHKTVAVSDRFFLRILRGERMISRRLDNPLLAELTTTGPCYLVTGLSRGYADLIARQVERLADQRDSTPSESTL